ncbi:hypothetical protein GOP47_0006715 [Adiantum capillus-veneris]|uniref:Uncharacterized protein n=1 Tax=Adiantum capillus-veneris TaxID=13818 RepID=A0A9D4ZKP3_ADICA|nr:hypothetical protein GOP47_0006715 [Adiantum capillus-veneris]
MLHGRLDIGGDLVRIRDGESFQACLVFSFLSSSPVAVDRPTLIVHRRQRRRRRCCLQAWYFQLRRWCLQAWYRLLQRQCCLQADTDIHDVNDGNVFKLGTFRMSDLFMRIALDPDHPASTIIEELVLI